ncbi:MAG: hypothetical protein ACK56W_02060 [Pirellula sp.]|jgi:hypothetical protein|nr:hypothetical protein [Pirellula sp.]
MVTTAVNTSVSDGTTVISIPFPVAVESGLESGGVEIKSNSSDTEAQQLPNIALAPDEVATLRSLVDRYDQVIRDLDQLNEQIESLLQAEGIKACES